MVSVANRMTAWKSGGYVQSGLLFTLDDVTPEQTGHQVITFPTTYVPGDFTIDMCTERVGLGSATQQGYVNVLNGGGSIGVGWWCRRVDGEDELCTRAWAYQETTSRGYVVGTRTNVQLTFKGDEPRKFEWYTNTSFAGALPQSSWIFGNVYNTITDGIYGMNTESNWHHRVLSLRFYNRILTPAEIAANYAIDKARFNLPD